MLYLTGQGTGADHSDGASLTAKIVGTKMYTYVQQKALAAAGGGCCADTMRIFDRDAGTHTDVDLEALLATAFAGAKGVTFHQATHTFDAVQTAGAAVRIYLMVQYNAAELGGALVNACVAFETNGVEPPSLVKTAGGDSYVLVPLPLLPLLPLISLLPLLPLLVLTLLPQVLLVPRQDRRGRRQEPEHGGDHLQGAIL